MGRPSRSVTVVASVAVIVSCVFGKLFALCVVICCAGVVAFMLAALTKGLTIPIELYHHAVSKEDTSISNSEYDRRREKKIVEISACVIMDYIHDWYSEISDDKTFVEDVFKILQHVFNDTERKIFKTNWEILFSSLLIQSTSRILTTRQASDVVKNRAKVEQKSQTERNCWESEEKYLRGAIIIVLKKILPDYYKISRTPLYLISEILLQNVVLVASDLLSDPLNLIDVIKSFSKLEDLNTSHKTVESFNAETFLQNSIKDYSDEVQCRGIYNEYEICRIEDQTVGLAIPHVIFQEIQDLPEKASDELNLEVITNSSPLASSEFYFSPEYVDELTISQQELLNTIHRPKEKLFHGIRIIDTSIVKEMHDTSKRYTLYRITYGVKETNSSKAATQLCHKDMGIGNAKSSMVTYQVQRRFREFLVLQDKLSQNLMAKNLTAKIKGPSRMFPVPFGNMNSQYIEQRKKFLQAYLREISSIPIVSHAKELREFLAYKSDPRIAYVRKPDIMPRFDRLFQCAIQDFLRGTSAKRTDKHVDQRVFDAEGQISCKKTISLESMSVQGTEVNNVGAATKLKNKVFGVSRNTENENQMFTRVCRQFTDSRPQSEMLKPTWRSKEDVKCSELLAHHSYLQCRSDDWCEPAINQFNCTSDTLSADLLFQLIFHNWNMAIGHIWLINLLLRQSVQSYISSKITEWTSKHAQMKYLVAFHNLLCLTGRKKSVASCSRDIQTELDDATRMKTLNELEERVITGLPRGLRCLVGSARLTRGIKQVLFFFQDETLLRHLFQQAFCIIFKKDA